MAKLIRAFGSPRGAMHASVSEICKQAGLKERLAKIIAEFRVPEGEIKKDIEILRKLGSHVITRWDSDYPSILKEIYDPPALLFVRGELKKDERAVGIVGTRNPTRYGLDMARQIARDLARDKITVVSGLARGIDTACHVAALKEGGRTIGVLGCGIDVVYPKENKNLIEQIVQNGAVVTEFRPQTLPLATNFYRRNRIISGLSSGVVVVEAAINSGSLITAAHAIDQNRDVFAVPGNVMSKRSSGPHHLIKQGAGLVESARDIIDSLFNTIRESRQESLFEMARMTEELSEEALKVLEALDLDPVPIDIIGETLQMEPNKLSGILLELELSGLVRQYPGKMFGKISG